ncbi:MAG: biotin/lipoyl-binding protein, partial [Hyphomicrobiales bacterium]|nr:biotin/lipoyl-binding protein [Hyphomicrobiales bacterium]
MATKPTGRRAPITTAIAIAAIAFAAYRAWTAASPSALIPGVVHETEIRVAPETTGRLVAVKVKPGDHVKQGDVLAILSAPEVTASLLEAKANAASARANQANVDVGVRQEEVHSAAQNVSIGEVNLVLEQKQYTRAATLAAQSFASKQQLDESTASLKRAQASLDLARAVYAQDVAGPTKEERAIAEVQVAVSDATVADL